MHKLSSRILHHCTDGYRNSSSTSCSFTCPYTNQFLNFRTQSCESCASSCTKGCIEARDNCNFCYSGEYYRPDLGTCNSTCPQYGGFYASSTENRCIPCRDPNCLRCKSNGDCEECKSFYNLNTTTGRCSWKCPRGCKTCSQWGTCTQCESGWSLSGGSCYCSQANCRQCGTSTCNRCEEGYVKDTDGICRAKISNCRQYSSITTCEVCEPGYYLNYGYCSQCATGCRHCLPTRYYECTACENGYYMSTTYNSYPTCLVKTFQPTPQPKSSNAGLIIGLTVGGVFCLIILGVIIAQVNKKKKLNEASVAADATGALGANYIQHNDVPNNSDVVYYPPENHPQRNFYQVN